MSTVGDFLASRTHERFGLVGGHLGRSARVSASRRRSIAFPSSRRSSSSLGKCAGLAGVGGSGGFGPPGGAPDAARRHIVRTTVGVSPAEAQSSSQPDTCA